MNNKFEWNRFCRVVAKDFKNIWPTFGPTLIIITALPVAVWLLMLVIDVNHTGEMPAIWRSMMIGGLVELAAIMTPSRLYRTMNLRNEGIYFAMLPASKLEKFLSILLHTLIICPLIVLIGSYVVDFILWVLPFGSYAESIFSVDWADFSEFVDESELPTRYVWFWSLAGIIGNLATYLLFLFTATLFKNHKVLQTILWLWLISFVLSIIGMPIMTSYFSSDNFQVWVQTLVSNGLELETLMNWFSGLMLGFNTVLAVLFGWLSWRRLNRMPY